MLFKNPTIILESYILSHIKDCVSLSMSSINLNLKDCV